jgi:hypothetical protein
MSWLRRRLRGNPATAEARVEQVRPTLPTVKALPGYALTPPARPKRGDKTTGEFQADLAAYETAFRAHIAHNAAISRERSMSLGITSYRWVAVDVHGTCEVAARNGGKVFRYDAPPPEGHVGEGQCNSPDWCRCVPRPVIPGFSD